jgi:hypothetical protein
MLNKNISAEQAALLVSKGLKNEELLAFMRADKDETKSLLEQYGVRETSTKEHSDNVLGEFKKGAEDRQKNAEDAATKLDATEGGLVNKIAGYWDYLWDVVDSVWSQMKEWAQWIWDNALGGWLPGGNSWDWLLGEEPEQKASGGTTTTASIIAGEEGPEMATMPNGSRAMLPVMGLYNVPIGTHISTAAETAAMFAGAFADGGTAPRGSRDERLWKYVDTNNYEQWKIGPQWALEEATELKQSLGAMADTALNTGKLSQSSYRKALRILDLWIDPNHITSIYTRAEELIGYESHHRSWGEAGRMRFERRPDIHGGVMSESTPSGLLTIVLSGISGFADGGFVGMDNLPYTMPTNDTLSGLQNLQAPYVSTPNPAMDLSNASIPKRRREYEYSVSAPITINANVRSDRDIDKIAEAVQKHIQLDAWQTARRRGVSIIPG